MSPAAATQPASDVKLRLNQVGCFHRDIYILKKKDFPAVIVSKSALTAFSAFKQSLFESQLEDYACDMQRVCWRVLQNNK